MIGYIAGKFLANEDNNILVDVHGVGYSLCVPTRLQTGYATGAPVELYVHTNLRENALELFGFSTAWEKRVFLALTSVSGVGPKTAVGMLSGLEPESILSAVVREDRATLTSTPGIGKKTAERLILELGEKARKLLAERPASARGAVGATARGEPEIIIGEGESTADAPTSATTGKRRGKAAAPSAATAQANLDIADLWNEALAALVGLGYKEPEAIAAIKAASAKTTETGSAVSLETLIRSSLQLMSRGLGV